jgi:putative ABC transport system permease protein
LLLLQCATALVLLVACTNVANLLLARVAAREKEMAIRSALGAGRSRLIRLLLSESIALAVAGGALGLLLAIWGIDALVGLAPEEIPRLDEISIDGRALSFAVALSLATVLFFGLMPAWQASRININEALKESSRSATRGQGLRGALVVGEVALTLVLLIGAGLLLRSLSNLQNVELGFNPDNLLVMRVSLLDSKYKDRTEVANYYRQALERIETIPGVATAAIANSLPMARITRGIWNSFEIEGQPVESGREPRASYWLVSPAYFRAMAIPFIKGREFDARDIRGATAVAIVNEQFVSRHFAGADPIGKKIIVNRAAREIVGVVADVKHDALEAEEAAGIYVPHAQNPAGTLMLIVRADRGPSGLAAPVSRVIWDSDPDAAVSNVTTMNGLLSDAVSRPRFNALLLGIFSIVALVLASVGIYGVLSYTVAESTREIGIRVALGARPADVVRLIVGQGLVLGLIGIALGVAAAVGLTQFLKSLLFGVAATDPLTFAAISVLLISVVTVACYVPARRASRVDPMVALRHE